MNFVSWQVQQQGRALGDRELCDLFHDVAELMQVHDRFLARDCGKAVFDRAVRAFKGKWFDGSREERLKKYMDDAIADARRECRAMQKGE